MASTPTPGCGQADANADFTSPTISASPCNFSIGLPTFSIGFNLPSIAIAIPIPTFSLAFNLSCDLKNPIDITAGLEFGGGRIACAPADPDNSGIQ